MTELINPSELRMGKTWYLAKSTDGKKKGWIREDEFGWIIDPIL